MRRKNRVAFGGRILGILVLGALLCGAATPGTGTKKLYRWVDQKGVTHYTEQMPTEASVQGASELNKQGTVVRQYPPAPTAAELEVREAEKRDRAAAAEQAKIEQRKNAAVLNSYASAKDIEAARDRALSLNSDVTKNAEHNITEREKKRAELSQRIQAAPKSQQGFLQQQLTALDKEVEAHQTILAIKQREKEQINAKYDEDLRRFLRLTHQSEAPTETVVKQ